MEQIINDTTEFINPVFLLNSRRQSFEPYKYRNNIFLTQEGNTGLKEEIIKLINNAMSVIKICTFIITDKEIYQALITKAHNPEIAIFLLTQLDERKLKTTENEDILTIEELNENSSRVHFNCIKSLFDRGVHVRASEFAHAKFMIVDRKVAFITSANLTTPSLSLNTEIGLYTSSEDAVKFDNLFDVIFTNGTRYRKYIAANKKKMFVVQSEANIESSDLPAFINSRMRYTFDSLTTNLYQELVDIVNRSNKFLYISTYSIVKLENLPELINSVRSAIKRGVDIKIFCRGMNYRTDHLSGCKILLDLGCELYADVYNHSKGIINENEGMMFTANIDGRNGLKNGFEMGYILDGSDREEYLTILQSLINTSLYTFSPRPKRRDFFETYREYERIKNISAPKLPEEITIAVNNSLGINIRDLSDSPLFFSKTSTTAILQTKSKSYRCNYTGGVFNIISEETQTFHTEKYLLKYNNLKLIYHNEH